MDKQKQGESWWRRGWLCEQKQLCAQENPVKRFENYKYSHICAYGVEDDRTSATYNTPGHNHNRNATQQNMMGRTTKGSHKMTMPSQTGRQLNHHWKKTGPIVVVSRNDFIVNSIYNVSRRLCFPLKLYISMLLGMGSRLEPSPQLLDHRE